MLFICSISYVLFNVLTAQKMKFSQFPQETEYLVTFTEEILNGKLHFLCSAFGVTEQKRSVIDSPGQNKSSPYSISCRTITYQKAIIFTILVGLVGFAFTLMLFPDN